MRLVSFTVALCVIGLVPVAHAGGGTGSSDTGATTDTGSSSGESSSTDASSSESGTGSEATSGATTATDDGTTTDGTGTDTTGGVADDTTTAPGTEEGGCDACPTGDESIAFDEPAADANVDSPFTVTVDAVPRCPCFDCSCAAEDPEYVQLYIDTLAWAGPCYESPCTWEVSATLGSHELSTYATYLGGEASTSILVFVTSVDAGTSTGMEPDPTTAPPDTAETTTSGSGAVGEPAPAGCGCATPAPMGGAPIGWALTLVMLGLRRRAR